MSGPRLIVEPDTVPFMNRPYLPIPSDPAVVSRLILLKEAASRYHCSVETLKNNAKAPNLRAFQDGFGAPVLVLPEDVEDFLKRRPAVASVFHPQRGKSTRAVGDEPVPSPWRDVPSASGEGAMQGVGFQGEGASAALGLSCLRGASPAEIAFAARLFAELARVLTNPAGSAVLLDEPGAGLEG